MELTEKITRCLAKHPDWTTARISSSAGGNKAMIEAIRRGEPVPEVTNRAAVMTNDIAPASGPISTGMAFSLRGVHLLSKKPLDVMKGRLYGLERGMGYKVEDLARAWGVSVDTLKAHAKNHRALAYVEATPGEYVPVIVHPETTKGDSL